MRAVNLIPADQRSGSSKVTGRSDGAAFIVIGVIAGIAIMALMYGTARHQISSREGEATRLTAQAQVTQARANQLTPYTSFNALHEERVKEISELVGTRFDWAHAFHELGRVLPADVSLSSVQGTISGAGGSTSTPASTSTSASTSGSTGSVSSATPPGSVPTMNLAGCTVSQSEVAVVLARLRLIDGVSEVQLQNSAKGGSSGSSSASSGASGSGSCPVAFTAAVTFTAIPTPSTSTSAASSRAASTGATSTPTTTTQSTTATTPTATTQTAAAQPSSSSASASGTTSTRASASTSTAKASGGD